MFTVLIYQMYINMQCEEEQPSSKAACMLKRSLCNTKLITKE